MIQEMKSELAHLEEVRQQFFILMVVSLYPV